MSMKDPKYLPISDEGELRQEPWQVLKLTPEQQVITLMQELGRTRRVMSELLEDKFGKEEGLKLFQETLARVYQPSFIALKERLGIIGEFDVFGFTKCATVLEEINHAIRGTEEMISAHCIIRTVDMCPWGEVFREEDCLNIFGAVQLALEEIAPDVRFDLLEAYPVTRERCRWRVQSRGGLPVMFVDRVYKCVEE